MRKRLYEIVKNGLIYSAISLSGCAGFEQKGNEERRGYEVDETPKGWNLGSLIKYIFGCEDEKKELEERE